MLALTFDPQYLCGDLTYANGSLVHSGFDLETAILLSLYIDASATEADGLPSGLDKKGWWADAYTDVPLGSRLWILEHEVATQANAARAIGFAKEALAWIISDGYVRAIDVAGDLIGDNIFLRTVVTLTNGDVVNLGPFKVGR